MPFLVSLLTSFYSSFFQVWCNQGAVARSVGTTDEHMPRVAMSDSTAGHGQEHGFGAQLTLDLTNEAVTHVDPRASWVIPSTQASHTSDFSVL